jgi:hypothetical protein
MVLPELVCPQKYSRHGGMVASGHFGGSRCSSLANFAEMDMIALSVLSAEKYGVI